MADIVAGDDEIGALLVTAAQNDVGVGMAGVEVVDRHPVELRSEILLHPRHQSPGERFQILIVRAVLRADDEAELVRSEEHTSELQSLMRISYAVFCLKKKTTQQS